MTVDWLISSVNLTSISRKQPVASVRAVAIREVVVSMC